MELTQKDIAEVSSDASELFERLYADLIACFDSNEFWKAMAAEAKTAGLSEHVCQNFTLQNLLLEAEKHFLALLDRGALTGLQRFGLTEESKAQITKIENKVNVATVATTPLSATPVIKSEVETCAEDFKALPSRQFSAKWLGVKRTIYEQCFQEGRI